MNYLVLIVFLFIATSLCQRKSSEKNEMDILNYNDTYCPQCRTRTNKKDVNKITDIKKRFTEYFGGDEECEKSEERDLKFEVCPDYDYSDYIFNATRNAACLCVERDQRIKISLNDQSSLFCCAPDCQKAESRRFFFSLLASFIVWGVGELLDRFVFDVSKDVCCYEKTTVNNTKSTTTTASTTTTSSTTLPPSDPCEEF